MRIEIGTRILDNAYYFGDTPKPGWNVYNLPRDCYYLLFGINSLDIGLHTTGSSILMAIDKITGEVKYFGSAYD